MSSDEEDDESHDGRTHVTHHTTHTAHTAHTAHTSHTQHALPSGSRASTANMAAAAQMSMNNASKNDSYGAKKMGGVGSGAAATGQEFIIQLATTRKMLYNILEKHDAVPDRVSTCVTGLCFLLAPFLRKKFCLRYHHYF